ncbi:hypothetical protein [Streptomyces violascens]|uniref:hypothetical protein n=1 Tax=Streptomyces violascens TaxID=67381 RepID=UPI001673FEED|nr:hypothetical protein [Streptomyces violascens]
MAAHALENGDEGFVGSGPPDVVDRGELPCGTARGGDSTLAATGMITGTPAFMATEQVRGLLATAASELWSLGAMLYAAAAA